MKRLILPFLLALVLVAGCAGAREGQDRVPLTRDQEAGDRFAPEQEGLARSYDSLTPRRTRSEKQPGEWNVRPPMDKN
jgi:hypothetical protein